MANTSKKKAQRLGVTASGLVEAIEQDVELSMEQVKEAAHDAVAAVEKKLGMGKPPARKPAKPKARITNTTISATKRPVPKKPK